MSAIARMKYIEDDGFQKRVRYYFLLKALSVVSSVEPDETDLKLAQAIIANTVDLQLMCNIVITNSSIASDIDSGNTPPDDSIEYAVITEGKFTLLAEALNAAGLI